MTNKANGPAKSIQPEGIPLWDGVLRMIDRMPVEERAQIAQVFLMLMACAEGDRLNMDKVAQLGLKLTEGNSTSQGEEVDIGGPASPPS